MTQFKTFLREKAGEHTHVAHCQVCGRQHALHNKKQEIAKHGYTVQGAHIGEKWFAGQCYGSHCKPLEHSHEVTDKVIASMHEQHRSHTDAAESLRSRRTNPARAMSGKNIEVQKQDRITGLPYKVTEPEFVPYEHAPIYHQESARKLHIARHLHNAEAALSHAKGLEELKARVHGKPPALARPPKEAPAPKAHVDYQTGKVTGTFKTKSERGEHLSHINHLFSKKIDELQAHYLALPHHERTEAKTHVYYAPMYPHEWKPKHSAAALKEFPAAHQTVKDIESLVAARKAVKEAP